MAIFMSFCNDSKLETAYTMILYFACSFGFVDCGSAMLYDTDPWGLYQKVLWFRNLRICNNWQKISHR